MTEEEPASLPLNRLVTEVYVDVAKPSARRIGAALDTIFKIGLAPVSVLDFGYEQAKPWLVKRIADRMKATPVADRQEPAISMAARTIGAIVLNAAEPDLRDLYAELLLKAMDRRWAKSLHPSFVNVVEQICPDEARLLASLHNKRLMHPQQSSHLFSDSRSYWNEGIARHFTAHCAGIGIEGESAAVYFDNLQRLRLAEVLVEVEVRENDDYKALLEGGPRIENVEHRSFCLTDYGVAFLNACLPVEEDRNESGGEIE